MRSGQDEVGLGIVGLDLDSVFGAQIGGVEVAAVFIELRYAEVFGDAFVVGLEILDLGEFAAGGSGAGGVSAEARTGVGRPDRRCCWSCCSNCCWSWNCCYCCSSLDTSGRGLGWEWVLVGCR